MRQRLPAIFALLLLALASGACDYYKFDTKEDPTLEEIMNIGKSYLRAGDGGNASDAFQAALKLSPDCSEAKYGLLIARNQQFIALVNELIGFIGGMQRLPPADPVGGLHRLSFAEESEPIGDYIQDFLAQSADVWYRDCEFLYNDLLDDPDPFFEIDRFSMSVEGIIEFKFGGRLDRTDLQFFGVLNALVRSVVDFALAYDLNFDLLNLEIPSLDIDLTGLTENFSLEALAELVGQLDPIFELLEGLLTDPNYPNFLMLKGEEGEARVQASGIEFGMLFDRVHLLIQNAYAETATSPPNTVHVIDADGNGRFDRLRDPLSIPGLGLLEADLVNGLDVLATLTAPAFWDTTAFDLDPERRNAFYIAFANDLLVALDVLPLVIDKEMLDSILEALGVDPSIIGEDFEIIIPEIPYILPIDIGPWFAEPSTTGVRDLLWGLLDLWDLIGSLLPTS